MSEAASPVRRTRLDVIDAWRGLVVVLMALDHVKDFLMKVWSFEVAGTQVPDGIRFVPWLTRFVTHYCAPSFVFLAGASVVLFAESRRARGTKERWIAAHLVLRGALLVALEFTVVAWGWANDADLFMVIACLGALLALGSVLRFVPGTLAFALGVLLMFAHPWLAELPRPRWLSSDGHALLFRPSFFTDPRVIYPIVPWLAPFLLGIGFGHALRHHAQGAVRRLLPLGGACLALWLALRLTDGFAAQVQPLGIDGLPRLGNLTPHGSEHGWQGFLWMSKYPPAADFLLWTLGGAFVLASLLARANLASSRWVWPLRVFGRAPLFFYCTHLFLYRHLAASGWFERDWLQCYLLWLLGLALLLPPCLAFGWLKQRWKVFPLDLF
jgi:uncharacterized membrane protein